MNNILHPANFSKSAGNIFIYSHHLTRETGADVSVLHVASKNEDQSKDVFNEFRDSAVEIMAQTFIKTDFGLITDDDFYTGVIS